LAAAIKREPRAAPLSKEVVASRLATTNGRVSLGIGGEKVFELKLNQEGAGLTSP
jgi:hypothetical protein